MKSLSRHFTLALLLSALAVASPALQAQEFKAGFVNTDRIFRELPDLLQPGDLLVFNDTKVIKARVFGEKASGGKIELLVERVLQNNEVVAHMRVSKKPLPGAKRLFLSTSKRC